MTDWTDETKARAAKMWKGGATGSEIGAAFGCSRSAAIGMIHRNPDLFPPRPATRPGRKGGGKSPAPAIPSRPRQGTLKQAGRRPDAPPRFNAPPRAKARPEVPDVSGDFIPGFVASKPLLITELTLATCRWPLWDIADNPGASGLYCGEVAADGSSWCRHHRVMSRPGWKAQVAG